MGYEILDGSNHSGPGRQLRGFDRVPLALQAMSYYGRIHARPLTDWKPLTPERLRMQPIHFRESSAIPPGAQSSALLVSMALAS